MIKLCLMNLFVAVSMRIDQLHKSLKHQTMEADNAYHLTMADNRCTHDSKPLQESSVLKLSW